MTCRPGFAEQAAQEHRFATVAKHDHVGPPSFCVRQDGSLGGIDDVGGIDLESVGTAIICRVGEQPFGFGLPGAESYDLDLCVRPHPHVNESTHGLGGFERATVADHHLSMG